MRRWAGFALDSGVLLLALSCRSESTTPAYTITGLWDFTETLVNDAGVACSDTGSYALVQAGSSFAGVMGLEGTCSLVYRQVSPHLDATDTVTAGQILRPNLAFDRSEFLPA